MEKMKRMLKKLSFSLGIIALVSLLTTGVVQAQTVSEKSMVGRWKTIDDVTGKQKSIVRIQKGASGEYVAIVEETFAVNGKPPLKVCEKCTGQRKNQPIIGMTVMWNMEQKEDGSYGGGEIIDPSTGKIYRCSAKLDESGKELVVRGYLGISLLGRSQTWIRES